MGYDEDPSMVEVNIFKPSGKWYATLAVRWITWPGQSDKSDPKTIVLIHEAFAAALRNSPTANKLMREVCLLSASNLTTSMPILSYYGT